MTSLAFIRRMLYMVALVVLVIALLLRLDAKLAHADRQPASITGKAEEELGRCQQPMFGLWLGQFKVQGSQRFSLYCALQVGVKRDPLETIPTSPTTFLLIDTLAGQ